MFDHPRPMSFEMHPHSIGASPTPRRLTGAAIPSTPSQATTGIAARLRSAARAAGACLVEALGQSAALGLVVPLGLLVPLTPSRQQRP